MHRIYVYIEQYTCMYSVPWLGWAHRLFIEYGCNYTIEQTSTLIL